jgi:outer membrane lipoprotein-sorting protein
MNGKGSESETALSANKAAIEAACKETDKNICKFMASWQTHEYYTVKMKSTGGEADSESTYKSQGDNKFHMIVSATASSPAYETITIDKAMYTKAPNGVWWKQVLKDDEPTNTPDFSFDDSDDAENSDEPAAKTTYKNLGTETCGNLTCHKYQVITPGSEDTEYIWFDTKDYQLRKQRTESKDGSVTESTFSYEKIAITAPSPVKELGPNQYLVPGENEPQTLPDTSSMQDYMNSLPAGSGADGSAEL